MKERDEFSMIRSFVHQWGDTARGIGDDGALLDIPQGEKLVVSTDSSVEDVHFNRRHLSATEIGYRAAAAALSDLAAMAARPLGLLFALVLPGSWDDDADRIAEGVGSAARLTNCHVIGGNISRGGRHLAITTTVLGSVRRPLQRAGARPGDLVYVTGELGGAANAVAAWEKKVEPSRSSRSRFTEPVPRIAESLWLADQGATSAIDISDGLAADARHVAEAGNVRMVLDAGAVPIAPGASFEEAIAGGEDYELLVTARSLDTAQFRLKFGVALTEVGVVEKGSPEVEVRRDGIPIAIPSGYDHLAHK